MVVAIVPLVVAVAGLLLWALASNAKVAEAGKVLFFCGTLALCMGYSHESVRLGK